VFGGDCVLRRVAVWRAVAAARRAARLTRSQVNPPAPDLHTLFTLTLLRKLDQLNRLNVLTTLSHTACSLDLYCRRALASRFSSFLDDADNR